VNSNWLVWFYLRKSLHGIIAGYYLYHKHKYRHTTESRLQSHKKQHSRAKYKITQGMKGK